MMKLFQSLRTDSNLIVFSNTSHIGSYLVAFLPDDLLNVPRTFTQIYYCEEVAKGKGQAGSGLHPKGAFP